MTISDRCRSSGGVVRCELGQGSMVSAVAIGVCGPSGCSVGVRWWGGVRLFNSGSDVFNPLSVVVELLIC